MPNWSHSGIEHYDRIGIGILRLGSMFVGVWFGIELVRHFPAVPYWLTVFFVVLGIALILFARNRAKNEQSEDDSEGD